MPGIRLKEGDSFEGALRKFKKSVEKAGVLSELRKRECYEKPCVQRKRKEAQARKRGTRRTTSRSM